MAVPTNRILRPIGSEMDGTVSGHPAEVLVYASGRRVRLDHPEMPTVEGPMGVYPCHAFLNEPLTNAPAFAVRPHMKVIQQGTPARLSQEVNTDKPQIRFLLHCHQNALILMEIRI
jgi:hypothetical protein